MTVVAIATFADEGSYLRARVRAVAEERRIVGEWLPYAATSLGAGDGEQGIRAAAIVIGLIGGAALMAVTIWSAVVAYPFDAGGRPVFSWPAFIPAPVEFGALCAGFAGLVMLFRNARLTRLHHAAFDFDEVARAAQDSFVLALACDMGADANGALALMATAGAAHSRLIGG
ncbi:quinol:cytochrome c oxidoreductase membrane protein [Sphingomonas gellani]|uniref:Quinol:cytochrome c oxidoreductase membrane protein n=1 Tax=Sphingomonas gellani TaxID=1166340 RepID=A0A1H7ZFI1_9SPHN|nr:quinol:electron acceptor oxidoreductase subunit ActD [Sphingomonas gellani]SEM57332.1 quinol:cytochrome c oxidoreductase membrane protein [Sphingomonas gellani]